MQPTNDQPQRSEPYSAPPAGYQPVGHPGPGEQQPSWDAPPAQSWQSQQWQQPAAPPDTGSSWGGSPGYQQSGPTTTVKRGRPWLVAIVSFITLLVLIGALGNQWVTDHIAKDVVGSSFTDNVKRAALTYQWRFSPRGGSDFAHFWLASLCLVGTALVLTFLFVAVICRGKGGFWQGFFGAWFAVVLATIAGAYERAAVIDAHRFLGTSSSGNKANVIFFSSLSPNSFTIAAGLGFGILVGLAAGLTALISRQTEVLAAPVIATGYPPAPPDSTYAPEPAYTPVPGPVAAPSPWGGGEETTAIPRSGQPYGQPVADERADEAATADESRDEPAAASDAPQETAVLPSVDEPTREPARDETQQTTELPRSGDDGAPDDDSGPRHSSQ